MKLEATVAACPATIAPADIKIGASGRYSISQVDTIEIPFMDEPRQMFSCKGKHNSESHDACARYMRKGRGGAILADSALSSPRAHAIALRCAVELSMAVEKDMREADHDD